MSCSKCFYSENRRLIWFFVFLFWGSSVCYGWAIDAFSDQWIKLPNVRFKVDHWFVMIQSPFTALILSGCFFSQFVMFLDGSFREKLLVHCVGISGAIVAFVFSIGVPDKWANIAILTHWDLIHNEGILSGIDQAGWFPVFYALFSGVMANFLLSKLLVGYRLSFFGKETNGNPSMTSGVGTKVLCWFGLIGLILSVSVPLSDQVISVVYFRYGTLAGLTVSCCNLFSYYCFGRRKLMMRGFFLLFLWGLVGAVFYCFAVLGKMDWNPVEREFGPAILTACLLFALQWTVLVSLRFAFIHPPKTGATYSNDQNDLRKNEDPFSDFDDKPIEPILQTIGLQAESDVKNPAVEEPSSKNEIRLKKAESKPIHFCFWSTFLLIIFSCIGYQVPKFFSPYVLVTTSDWEFATFLAKLRIANGGDPYYQTNQDEASTVEENYLKPLVNFDRLSKCYGFRTGLKIQIEIQPLVDADPDQIATIQNLKKRYSSFLTFRYSTKSANGGIYNRLIALADHVVLDGADIKEENAPEFLAKIPLNSLSRVKNIRITKEAAQRFLNGNVRLENCQFDPDVEIGSVFGHWVNKLIIFDNCRLNVRQWINCVGLKDRWQLVVYSEAHQSKLPEVVSVSVENLKSEGNEKYERVFHFVHPGFDHPRKAVDRWTFSIKENYQKRVRKKRMKFPDRKQGSIEINENVESDVLDIKNRVVTGILYRASKPNSVNPLFQAKNLEWLKIPAKYLIEKDASYKIFQQPFPRLKHLSIQFDNNLYGLSDAQLKLLTVRIQNLCRTSNLETLEIDLDKLEFLNGKSFIKPILKHVIPAFDAETIIVDQPQFLPYPAWFRRFSNSKRLRQVVFCRFIEVEIEEGKDESTFYDDSFWRHSEPKEINWFVETYLKPKKPFDVYMLREMEEIPFKFSFEELPEKYKEILLLCEKRELKKTKPADDEE